MTATKKLLLKGIAIIATAIGATINDFIREHIISIAKFCWNICTAFWHHLSSTTEVCWWVIYLASIVTISLIIFLLIFCYQFFKNHDWKEQYRSDTFEGVFWRWNYYGREIQTPTPYCPKCQMQLILKDDFHFGFSSFFYYCEYCGFSSKVFSQTEIETLQNKIIRLIARKINTGEWEQAAKTEANKTQ